MKFKSHTPQEYLEEQSADSKSSYFKVGKSILTIKYDVGNHGWLEGVWRYFDGLKIDGDRIGDRCRDHVLDGDRFLARVQNQKLQRSRFAICCQKPEIDKLLGTINSGLGRDFDLER